MESVIKWKFGEPLERGQYLLSTEAGIMTDYLAVYPTGKKQWRKTGNIQKYAYVRLSEIEGPDAAGVPILNSAKVPCEAFLEEARQRIKELEVEQGKLLARIDELEDEEEIKSRAFARAEAHKEYVYKQQRESIRTLQKQKQDLKRINNELLARIAKLQ